MVGLKVPLMLFLHMLDKARIHPNFRGWEVGAKQCVDRANVQDADNLPSICILINGVHVFPPYHLLNFSTLPIEVPPTF
ncbi:hypothetical protein SAM19_02878 [Brevibacillus laterosporus]|nr:hypothetical protein [Brevibacillus laterosporus]